MKINNVFYLTCTISFTIILLLSCSKEDSSEHAQGKQVAISVSLTGISESDEAPEITRGDNNIPSTQVVTVPAGNGMTLEATLERNTPVATRGVTALAAGVKYRVIAFKQNDVGSSGYISYADYVVGTTSAIAGELHAPLGSSVTFVCYSLGKTTSLPAFNQNSLDVAANPATDDLLYAKFNQTITTESHSVSFTLKHQFSLVTVIADATSAGKNISAISASLSPNYSATLDVPEGTLAAGTAAARTIPWGTITAGQTVTATPCTVFANGSDAVTVNISSATIGGVTKTNLTASFGSDVMLSGYKYTLRLRFIVEIGIKVAGIIWAPGNLIYSGGIYSFAATQEYYSGVWNGGDYWGWCQLDPTILTSYNNYYSTSADPCQKIVPVGTWRMPKQEELNSLISAGSAWTTKNGKSGRYFGTTSAATANANPNNYVFLPAGGYREAGNTTMSAVGTSGRYWSDGGNKSSGGVMPLTSSNPTTGSNGDVYGFSIRCVK